MRPITTPTLLLDTTKCRQNIQLLVDKAREHQLIPRPHFKAHQSAEIGQWFRQAGVDRIAVSSVGMACYFAGAGWRDILIAAPVNILEIARINQLAADITLGLVVTMPGTAEFLAQHLAQPVQVWIEVEAGYRQMGVDANDLAPIKRLVALVQESTKMQFAGFYAHAGHTPPHRNPHVINTALVLARQALAKLRDQYVTDLPELQICFGDTPTAILADDFSGIDELSAGSLVFYDLTQYFIGSCQLEQIALALACPVVAKNTAHREILVCGGAIHLSKEYIELSEIPFYGYVVNFTDQGWTLPVVDTYVKALSQEHATIKASEAFFAEIQVGDLLGILPVRASLTASAMKQYLTLGGEWIAMMGQENPLLP